MDKTTIMIIDDEKQMRELIRTFLEKDGYTVIEAANGFDALTILSEQIPDLMLVDVMMPYMDGFSFVTEARKFTTAPIIFLTATGEEWDKVNGLKLGGDEYMIKRFRNVELMDRMKFVIRRSRTKTNE